MQCNCTVKLRSHQIDRPARSRGLKAAKERAGHAALLQPLRENTERMTANRTAGSLQAPGTAICIRSDSLGRRACRKTSVGNLAVMTVVTTTNLSWPCSANWRRREPERAESEAKDESSRGQLHISFFHVSFRFHINSGCCLSRPCPVLSITLQTNNKGANTHLSYPHITPPTVTQHHPIGRQHP